MVEHDPETGEVLETSNRISVDQVRRILSEKHNTNLPSDDPMFLTVTIFNALMDDAEKSLEFKLGEVVSQFEAGLAVRLEPITQEALQSQIHGHMAKMRESGEIVERLLSTFKRYCFWLMICGTFTVLASIINIYLIVS